MSDTSERLRRALSEAIAGAGGIILSAYVVYPIDFVKTRLQLPGSPYSSMTNGFRRIIAEEGFLTLYQGVEGELLKGSLQNFIYLFSYDLLKGYAREERLLLVQEPQQSKVSHSRPLLNKTLRCYCHGSNSSGVRYAYKKERRRDSDSAAAGNGAAAGLRERRGSTSVDFRAADGDDGNGEEDESIESEKEHRTIVKVVTASKPLSTPAVTAAPNSSSSSADAASGSSASAAAGGSAVSSSTAPPSPVKAHPAQLSIVSNLLIGIVAGCFCQLFINPLSVIQTRIMTQAKQTAGSASSVQAARASSSIVGTALSIWRTEGFSAFYTGLLPAFILTSNPAIQFLVFDRLKAMLEMILRQHENPRAISALESFVIGAMSAT